MRPDDLRTIVLAGVLAVLILPMGGPYQVWVLVLVATIAAFDVWRNHRKAP